MGRCYEFGVVVREGCDHAMVVPGEGGRCECAACGASCPGRFPGCAAIVSRPGYVPVLAPAWALAAPAAAPAPEALPAAGGEGQTGEGRVLESLRAAYDDLAAQVRALAEAQRFLADAIAAVEAKLAVHDDSEPSTLGDWRRRA